MFRSRLDSQLRQVLGLVCVLVLSACNYPAGTAAPGSPTAGVVADTPQPAPTETASVTMTLNASMTNLPTPTETHTPTPSPTVTVTATATETPTATPSPKPSITPTYAILKARVLQQANCRYGPGAPYLYKYGVFPPTVLEVFGRDDAGSWALVRAVGGANACWVKADLLEVRGELMAVEPTYTELPRSPYYGAMGAVSASRDGDLVLVRWGGIVLRPGDDSLQTPYVVEAWVCQGGELVFLPVGSYGFSTQIRDEAGCSEPSHARVTAAEKHGYTPWVEVPWPPYEDDS